MTDFICCADESADAQHEAVFLYGGFAGTAKTWAEDFAPAWRERVLDRPPRIEYLHMSEIMRPNGRAKLGLTWLDAERKADEASCVLGSCGGLVPFVVSTDLPRFRNELQALAWKKGHTRLEAPDYLSFLTFVYVTVGWLQENRPETTNVEFRAEQNGIISRRLPAMLRDIVGDLHSLGRSDLANLVGTFEPAEKSDNMAQAADFLCWHERNASLGTLDRSGWTRRMRVVHRRGGMKAETTVEELGARLRPRFHGNDG